MTADIPKKRSWLPFWRLPDPSQAMCRECKVPCLVITSKKLDDGQTQYRQCPKCGKRVKTRYRDC